jgi:hypothetical protein
MLRTRPQANEFLEANGAADRLSRYRLPVPVANSGEGHTLGSVALRIPTCVENLPP